MIDEGLVFFSWTKDYLVALRLYLKRFNCDIFKDGGTTHSFCHISASLEQALYML